MEPKNRNILLIALGVAVVLLCCCAVIFSLALGSLFYLLPWRSSSSLATRGPVIVVTSPPVSASRQATRSALATRQAAATAAARSATTPAAGLPTPGGSATATTTSTPRAGATVPFGSGTPVAGTVAPAPGTQAPPTPGIPTPAEVVSTTEQLLSSVDMPQSDLRGLAMAFKPQLGNIPVVVNATPPTYKVGDVASFWTENDDTQVHHHISATLQAVTPHAYLWVENGVNLSRQDLQASADRFESKTYPTDREFFGSEWTPGVDNDPHLYILHAHDLGENVAGYYSSADEFSHLVNPYSNEKEMFYISVDQGGPPPNSDYYDGVLAHEFQHMIHWNNDRNEESWVNEGLSELAMHLNGYDTGGSDAAYLARPDTQINTWPHPIESEHYGASYLFMAYFLNRFGEDLMKAVVADKENGITGFNEALAKAGRPERFDDIFADWLVANYLNRPDADPKGRFGYKNLQIDMPKIAKTYDRLPASDKADVSQYGADYIEIRRPAGKQVTVTFDGQPQNSLVNTTPRGKYAWWSNRGDDSNSTLTRAFDLSGVDKATLNFSAWYDVENGWDYVYVAASKDGGKTWQILPARHTTDKDKSGNAFGPGWTGKSGGGDTPQWVDEQVDLSGFAGQKMLLRFEYVTDGAVNGPGFLIDNVSIPEINFKDDGEHGTDGWDSRGWILTDNVLAQHWLVELVSNANGGVQVHKVTVGPDGHGEVTADSDPNGNMMLIVSAEAPVTTERAQYNYEIMAK